MIGSVLLALLFLLSLVNTSNAKFVREELHPIPSVSMSAEDFLTGKPGKPVTLSGQLKLPKLGGKLPAVILLHGAGGLGGPGSITDTWIQVLNNAGYATFAVDSFAGREITNIPGDASKVSPISRTVDALRALEVLSKHPSVDPSRIAVMGQSHGSLAAIMSNVVRFQKAFGSPTVSFAAHVAGYSICSTVFRDDTNTTKPMLLLHGEADDWTPLAPCRAYSERLSAAGRSVRLISYPGAHHAYDAPAYAKEQKLPGAVSLRNCKLEEGDNGVFMNTETKKPFARADACVQKGVTIGYQEAAMKKSHEDVKAFLAETMKAK